MSVATTSAAELRSRCCGELPLEGRLEPWQETLLSNPEPLLSALGEGEAPVNVIDPGPMKRNGAELSEVAEELGVRMRIFFARKANKCLSLVDRARDLGHGVDLASAAELEEASARGVVADDLVVTAAVKPRPLLELSVDRAATVVLDNHDEVRLLSAIAAERGRPVRVAIRLAVGVPGATPTRFGLPPSEAQLLAGALAADPLLELTGLHFHLDGAARAWW